MLGPGLYLHFPFCVHRCGYCDFFTRVGGEPARRAFVDDLLLEVDLAASRPDFRGCVFQTVFFGGGTPSLLEGGEMERILERLRARFALAAGAEITVECNPESITPERMRSYRAAGVNRISLGVQSMDEEELRILERAHGAALAARRVGELRAAGFDNISLDLIYGLPASTHERWARTLAAAVSLRPDHLSAYLLTLEPHVPMARTCAPSDDDGARDQYEILREAAGAAGLRQYEISNFALAGRESRHNRNYWARGEYLGLGPSAHSHRDGRRWANVSAMKAYADAVRAGRLPREGFESVRGSAVAQEWIFLGLRNTDGIAWPALAEAAGTERTPRLLTTVEALQSAGMVEREGDRLRLAPGAYFISNSVFTELMAAL